MWYRLSWIFLYQHPSTLHSQFLYFFFITSPVLAAAPDNFTTFPYVSPISSLCNSFHYVLSCIFTVLVSLPYTFFISSLYPYTSCYLVSFFILLITFAVLILSPLFNLFYFLQYHLSLPFPILLYLVYLRLFWFFFKKSLNFLFLYYYFFCSFSYRTCPRCSSRHYLPHGKSSRILSIAFLIGVFRFSLFLNTPVSTYTHYIYHHSLQLFIASYHIIS